MSLLDGIRHLVSKKKVRYVAEGFDLDMTYITPRIVSMGFPSEGREGLYRNPMPQVQRFFDMNHKNRYKVYNLCSERSYDPEKFHGRAVQYPFDDHNPPPVELMAKFCEDVAAWLGENEANVAVVHCKAGKGRTGCMISCALVHLGLAHTADEALKIFGDKRTANGKGVTIPSQIRYVHYYERMLMATKEQPVCTHPLNPLRSHAHAAVRLCRVVMHSVPKCDVGGGCDPFIQIFMNNKKLHQSQPLYGCKGDIDVDLFVGQLVLCGDIKIILLDKDRFSQEKVCMFWFNTCFVPESNVLSLPKMEIDKALKDKKCEVFSAEFGIDLFFNELSGAEPAKSAFGGKLFGEIKPEAFVEERVFLKSRPKKNNPEAAASGGASSSSAAGGPGYVGGGGGASSSLTIAPYNDGTSEENNTDTSSFGVPASSPAAQRRFQQQHHQQQPGAAIGTSVKMTSLVVKDPSSVDGAGSHAQGNAPGGRHRTYTSSGKRERSATVSLAGPSSPTSPSPALSFIESLRGERLPDPKYEVGSKVWISHPTECFHLATVSTVSHAGDITVVDRSGDEAVFSGSRIDPLPPLDNVGGPAARAPEDLTALSLIHDPALLFALRHRFDNDVIYTFVGHILVSMNPFQDLPLYTPDVEGQYLNARESPRVVGPHIYAQASSAQQAMRSSRGHQAIIVTGESGSGKSFAVLHSIKFLTAAHVDLRSKAAAALAVLDALGTASTPLNGCASRLGKIIYVHHQAEEPFLPVRASVDIVFAELGRVGSKQLSGHRNFSIFYQMLAGLGADARARLGLSSADPSSYPTLAVTAEAQRAAEQQLGADAQRFSATCEALSLLGIPEAPLFEALAKVVLLGETPAAADEYLNLIDRTVVAINAGLRDHSGVGSAGGPAAGTSSVGTEPFIAVVDTPGFENFRDGPNGAEQLRTNAVAERLQAMFVQCIFRDEQVRYVKEGLDWSTVDFPDNHDSRSLSSGLDTLLHGAPTAPALLTWVDEHFSKNPALGRISELKTTVSVEHFAGRVEYATDALLSCPPTRPPADATTRLSGMAHALDRLREVAEVHFVRCLRPNQTGNPIEFIAVDVLRQMRSACLYETALVMNASSFSTRLTYERLWLAHYVHLQNFPGDVARHPGPALRAKVAELLAKVFPSRDFPAPPYLLGKTVVFLKYVAQAFLDHATGIVLPTAAAAIQAIYRRHRVRENFKRVRVSAIVFQALFRGSLARKRFTAERKAALRLQALMKGALARKRLREARGSAMGAIVDIVTAKRNFELAEMHAAALSPPAMIREVTTDDSTESEQPPPPLISAPPEAQPPPASAAAATARPGAAGTASPARSAAMASGPSTMIAPGGAGSGASSPIPPRQSLTSPTPPGAAAPAGGRKSGLAPPGSFASSTSISAAVYLDLADAPKGTPELFQDLVRELQERKVPVARLEECLCEIVDHSVEPSNQRMIVEAGGLPVLVGMMRPTPENTADMKLQAARVIANLATNDRNKPEIVLGPCILVMMGILGDRATVSAPDLARQCIRGIAQLCSNEDAVVKVMAVNGSAHTLVSLLSFPDAEAQRHATRALGLISRVSGFSVVIAGAGAVPHLVRLADSPNPGVHIPAVVCLAAMSEYEKNEAVLISSGAAAVFLRFCSGGDLVPYASRAARNLLREGRNMTGFMLVHGAAGIFVRLLSHPDASVLSDAVVCISQLVSSVNYCREFYEISQPAPAIQVLTDLLGDNKPDLSRLYVASSLINLASMDNRTRGFEAVSELQNRALRVIMSAVTVPALASTALKVLSAIASDESVIEKLIEHAGFLGSMVAFLKEESLIVQLEVLRILSTIVDDPRFAKPVDRAKVKKHIKPLVKSHNQEVRDIANLVIARIKNSSK